MNDLAPAVSRMERGQIPRTRDVLVIQPDWETTWSRVAKNLNLNLNLRPQAVSLAFCFGTSAYHLRRRLRNPNLGRSGRRSNMIGIMPYPCLHQPRPANHCGRFFGLCSSARAYSTYAICQTATTTPGSRAVSSGPTSIRPGRFKSHRRYSVMLSFSARQFGWTMYLVSSR